MAGFCFVPTRPKSSQKTVDEHEKDATRERTHSLTEEGLQSLVSFEDDVFIQKRGGELEEGEADLRDLSQRGWIAEADDVGFYFHRKKGRRWRRGGGSFESHMKEGVGGGGKEGDDRLRRKREVRTKGTFGRLTSTSTIKNLFSTLDINPWYLRVAPGLPVSLLHLLIRRNQGEEGESRNVQAHLLLPFLLPLPPRRPKMVKPFPTEILERIIFHYFRRDDLLHTPEDNFTLVTPTRGSTSLLLVSKDFRLLVLPSLFHSISISQQYHWEVFFRKGSGILDGEGEEARTRRSWVRELRINLDLELPISLLPDGSLPLLGSNPVERFLITLSSANHPSQPTTSLLPNLNQPSQAVPITRSYPKTTSFLPNLNRLTLLHCPTTSIPRSLLPQAYEDHPSPWFSRNLQQLEQNLLRCYEADPERKPNLEQLASLPRHILHGLYEESAMEKEKFLSGLGSKEVWMSILDPASVRETAGSSLWGTEEVVKHIVYPSSSSSSSSSSLISPGSPTTTTVIPPNVDTFLASSSIVDEFRWSAADMRRVRFVNVPLPLRRRLWAKLNKMASDGSEYDYDGEEEEEMVQDGEAVDWLLEALKKEWVWIEEDGRKVGFEEGLKAVEEEEEKKEA